MPVNPLSDVTRQTSLNEQEFNEFASYRVRLLDDAPPFTRVVNNAIEFNFHLGQRKVLESNKRIIAVIAGRQSGKTSVGPVWLHNEIIRKGPGLYMVVAPSYPLLIDSAIPKLEELFKTYRKLGEMRSNPLRFIISPEGERRLFANTKWADMKNRPQTVIRFGHAANPESLEAKTALAAWLDEAGQDAFKLASWEAIQGRVTTTMGRILITTTPYNLGWLKQRIIDPWEKAERNHPEIDVITYKSIMNPAFSQEEYYRLRETMPLWKWDMFYNGEFTVPAGLIYGVMREKESILRCKREEVPTTGPVYGGLDFGGPNTCAVMARRDGKTGKIYLCDTYFPGKALPIREHVRLIKQKYPNYDRFVGGAQGEGSFREEFWQNGLRVEAPEITDVQAGIDRLYGLISQEKLYVVEDLAEWWAELYTYQYETDPETGDVLPDLKIKSKRRFHHMDATRYLATLFGTALSNVIAKAGGERTQLGEYVKEVQGVVGLQQPRARNLSRNSRVARSNGGNRDPQLEPIRRSRRGRIILPDNSRMLDL